MPQSELHPDPEIDAVLFSSKEEKGGRSMQSSTVYCDTCDAANRPQARFCVACGQALAVPIPKKHTHSMKSS
jgi:hypothetical protein